MSRQRNRIWAALAVTLLLGALGAVGTAAAQDQTTRFLMSRMDSLEQRLRDLELELSRNPPDSNRGAAPTRAAEIELRMNQLEQSIRTLTGRNEEADHQTRQVRDRLDRLVRDVDTRLKELEASVANLRASPPAPGTADAGRDAAVPPPSPSNLARVPASPPAGPAPGPAKAASPPPPPPQPAAPGGSRALQGDTPDAQYKNAIALVRQRAFDDAERAFRAFLAVHPEDELAPNAQYWLGETLYVRQMYDEAARAFLTGYQQFPESDKALDSLLKLGLTLSHLGQKSEACASFDELLRRLPSSERRLRPKAELERKNLACG
jgi:tol-pal system protein YbgF